MKRQRGAALLLALWVIGLLSVLLGGLAVSVQLQQRQALWQSRQAQAALAAQAGLELAIANLLSRDAQRWQPDGQLHVEHFAGSTLRIRVTSERGKLDLNATPVAPLERLLRACGAGSERAKTITHALRTRRNKVPLRMLEEFRQLPGMSYALYERVLPSITVWSGTAEPDPNLVEPQLARALGLRRGNGQVADAGQILSVYSEATLEGGFAAQVQVTLVLLPAHAGGKPYRVLRWQE
ncbi:type II secretion system minor pseudopilin GspK [Pseudomonas sp. NPDC089996]|uniref:type II secretion system minor pseudopilin GspK n=1 Tax=Pseudomonas sp. NPDC089996 TaxID=3364474 RepID=UPI00381CB30C